MGLARVNGVGGGEQGTFYRLGLPALLCAGDLPHQEHAPGATGSGNTACSLRGQPSQAGPAHQSHPDPQSHRQGNHFWLW